MFHANDTHHQNDAIYPGIDRIGHHSKMTPLTTEEQPNVNLTSLLMELPDGVGVLHDVLRFFWKFDVNIRRIESRPSQLGSFDFFVDLEGAVGDEGVDALLANLKDYGVQKLLILDEKEGTFLCMSYHIVQSS